MFIWEWLRRAAMAVKRCKSRVKPVSEVYRKGLDASRAAKAQLDVAVKSTARDIHDFLTDEQVRDHVSHLLHHVSKNGALFVVRSYCGGPIIDIFLQSMQNRKADLQLERLERLEHKVAKLECEIHTIEALGLADMSRSKLASKYHGYHRYAANMNPKQEEMMKEYMMKHLTVKFLDDPIVRRVRPGRNVKQNSGIDPHFRR